MNIESVPSSDQQRVPEIETSVEVPVAQPTSSPHPVVDGTPDESVQPVAEEVPIENVVDERTHHEKLDSVDKDADSLTKKADEEEEDFITHVEEVHSII